ncbi:putative nuclease HARBI1 [Musca vetustissima]|uniref:putative nuclease HARBI1 n=1 Tax=Musca vetustissima TaxID=27455 RepID=UPI002AB7507E|nr:putative nuclease HARBI1 [Musca vetustissima]
MCHPDDESKVKRGFYDIAGFPGIIGCVDGTHIRIKSPGNDVKHLYYNRKGFYSINAMVVCDHTTKIMFVDARHPGANHDSFIWEQSPINEMLERDFENGKRNTWVLGDGGYKLKPYLMTPYRSPQDLPERTFNKKHISSRNVVERCFGVLKNRFRCILGSRGLHYDPQKATKIINVLVSMNKFSGLDEDEE